MAIQVREIGPKWAPTVLQVEMNLTQYNTMIYTLLKEEAARTPRTSIYIHHMLEELQVQRFQKVTETGCVCIYHQNECPFGARHQV